MNKIITTLLLTVSLATPQGDIYPTETTYGGGIGFSTMYMVLDSVPGEHILKELGLNVKDISSRPLVFHGGEGFAQMSGPWRLGGYAGLGAAQISNVFDIQMFINRDDSPGYQEPDLGKDGDTLYTFSENLSVKARLNFLMGAMTIGRYTLSVDQHICTPKWSNFNKNMYGYIENNSVMVEIDTLGRTHVEAANAYRTNGLRPININGTMTELSGTFFNFQPYIAIKWQFLDRMGLRISAGYNKGTIGSGKWRLNGHIHNNDSPKSALQGITLRTVIYFGL